MSVRFAATLLFVCAALLPAPTLAADAAWVWPITGGKVTGEFEPPASDYGPGHRGIDLSAPESSTVRAVAAGTVRFVGDVAGKGVVVVDHGSEQSTYEPVSPTVRVGQAVGAGESLGTLRPGHCATPCLHVGRKRGDTYLDPLALLGGPGRFRLINPDGPPPRPPGDDAVLALVVGGPVTSGFGWRVHPITGKRTFHDGLDFGAACGAAVHAAMAGVVTGLTHTGPYGLRVEVAHADGRGTSYSHLSSAAVAAGQHVTEGQQIGRVGNTGLSTGCHLHFSTTQNGRPVDPATLL